MKIDEGEKVMKKRYMMGLLFGVTVVVCAQSYVADIEVAPVKKGGKSWDVAGGVRLMFC